MYQTTLPRDNVATVIMDNTEVLAVLAPSEAISNDSKASRLELMYESMIINEVEQGKPRVAPCEGKTSIQFIIQLLLQFNQTFIFSIF